MFDLAPLNAYHIITALAVFLVTFLALWSVVFVFTPTSHQVPVNRVPNVKRSIYYVGHYLAIITILASAIFLIKEGSLLIGLIVSTILVMLIGATDEKEGLSPARQLLWQVIIAATVVYFGWTIPHISNPLGEGVIDLSLWSTGSWIFPGSILAILWLIFVMNAFNWLDGVDGLAGTVSLITFITLAAISLLPETQDSRTLALSLIGVAVMTSFLVWNFAPARVYLGTTGSWFIGLFIGLVALIGGGKMATVLLVLAIPALDAIFVIAHRIWERRAPWQGDKSTHLHFRLLEHGMSPRKISIVAGVATALLGATAVIMQTNQKIGLLFFVGVGMFVLSTFLYRNSIYRRSY